MSDAPSTGALVVVATPIGNLGDLPPRAVEELAAADLICCEDTRRTGQLLTHAGITRPPLRRLDAHTEDAGAGEVVRRIGAGERVALVSDAGTPGVSDPGARLVRAVIDAGLPVTTVPGPVAAVAALVVSGLDTARFAVDGFLPRKGPERSARLAELAAERRTTVIYEAPTRVARTLADLAAACGPDREAAVVREITKRFEEVWRGSLGDLAARADADAPRGEVVLVLAGAGAASASPDDDVRAALVAAQGRGLSPGRAAAEVAAAFGRSRADVYALALAAGDDGDDGEGDGDDRTGPGVDGVIRDPLREVLDASVRAPGDADLTTVDHADLTALRLARRRFGVALPPPFVAVPPRPADLPIRPGGPSDGAAIAAVQRRAWRVRYRGLLSDAFLDGLDLSYLGAYWSGRAAVSPGPRFRLFVAGRPGEVHGAVDTGPGRDRDTDGAGEVRSLYLDPTVMGGGLGSVLLATAVDALADGGFTTAVLWVVDGNTSARGFYEHHGWAADGATKRTPVDDEELLEVRYQRRLSPAR